MRRRMRNAYKLYDQVMVPPHIKAKAWFPMEFTYSAGLDGATNQYLSMPVLANAPRHPLPSYEQRYKAYGLENFGLYKKVAVKSAKVTLRVRWMGLYADSCWSEPYADSTPWNQYVPLQFGIKLTNHIHPEYRGPAYSDFMQRVHRKYFPKMHTLPLEKDATRTITMKYSFKKFNPLCKASELYDTPHCSLMETKTAATTPYIEDGVLIPLNPVWFQFLFAAPDGANTSTTGVNKQTTPGFSIHAMIEYNCVLFDRLAGDYSVVLPGIASSLTDYVVVPTANYLQPLDPDLDDRLYDDLEVY